LVIVDQIPNKLTPEILKNTNTKIVHKLFAEDDKEAIGNTIVLEKEQKEFLSNLETGRAIVFSQGFNKAVQVQIEEKAKTSDAQPDPEIIRENVLEFYAKNYKAGIIEGSQYFSAKPSVEQMEWLLELSTEETVHRLCMKTFASQGEINKEIAKKIKDFVEEEERLVLLLKNTFEGTGEDKKWKASEAELLKDAAETFGYEWLGYYFAELYNRKLAVDKKKSIKPSAKKIQLMTKFAKDYAENTFTEARALKDELKTC